MKEQAAPELARLARTCAEPAMRGQALSFLAEVAPNTCADSLAAALADDASVVRQAAAVACAKTGAEELVGDLVALVRRDADPDVRREALYALVDLGEMEIGGQPIAALLLSDLSHEKASVRAKAADLLGDLRAGEARGPLVRILESDEAPWVRARAAAALAKLRDRDAVTPLIAALDDESPMVQRAAKSALEAIAGESLGLDPAAWRAWLDAQGAGNAQ